VGCQAPSAVVAFCTPGTRGTSSISSVWLSKCSFLPVMLRFVCDLSLEFLLPRDAMLRTLRITDSTETLDTKGQIEGRFRENIANPVSRAVNQTAWVLLAIPNQSMILIKWRRSNVLWMSGKWLSSDLFANRTNVTSLAIAAPYPLVSRSVLGRGIANI
jgi:hypothetical protein